jgi:predicted SAM-dependent methyltransferase
MKNNTTSRLHLGCGQVYLDGYTNIDYPQDKHTVQEKSVADQHSDITKLQYKSGSIDEVRLHHVFEHFVRAQACALIASWHSWLKPEGTLHIEVPDFDRTAKNILSRFSSEHDKAVGLRHIFGSNEEFWAVHYEGWSTKRLSRLLKMYGFDVVETKTNSWKGTFNLEIIAKKKTKLSKATCEDVCRTYLNEFLVDASELPLLDVWLDTYRYQVNASWAK